MAKLSLQLPSGTQVFELRAGVHRMGRAPSNDIHVPDPSISSAHCLIDVSEIATTVRDLGSTNGTFVNDERLGEKPVILQSGQRIRFGNVAATFEPGEVQIAIPTVSGPEFPTQVFFQDGSAACLNHPGIVARYNCPKCTENYCGDCVNRLTFKGREGIYCPRCSTICELSREPSGAAKARRKLTFGSLIRDTVRLVFRQ